MDVSEASFEERPKGFQQKNKIKNKTKSTIETSPGLLLPRSYQTTRNDIAQHQI